ncbi:MAG: hypothetical protein ASARMPRED_006248 [Alectoria sarmentosa]|nr:MAG: hypothetical protein ASARMPRED_006248 [Alectoria sarmentosa]
MQLSWQPGFSLSRKPVRRSLARKTKRGAWGNSDGPQQFDFIVEQPVGNHRPIHSLSVTTSTHSGAPIESTADLQVSSDFNDVSLSLTNCSKNKHSTVSDEHGAHSQVGAVQETGPPINTPLWASSDTTIVGSDESPDSETSYGMTDLGPHPCDDEDQCVFSINDEQLQIFEGSNIGLGTFYERLSRDDAMQPLPATFKDLPNVSHSPSASIPPSILYGSLSQRFRPILDRYDEEYCRIPLTSDLRINPFRCRTDLDSEPIFLVHAVMALAGHHVESTSTQNHRHAALQLLRKSLDTHNNAGLYDSMLDSIIILFSLDETQSALGNWSTHLVGAYSLLEACGGIEAWATSARAEAQLTL